jgi:hypothetical protein
VPIEIDITETAPPDPRAEPAMVPMRDGIRLATDVFLPPDAGPVPAVLVRLPYDKGGRYTFMSEIAPSFTDRGYAFVVQDVRGKFRSEGETLAFVHEVDDGYDTLEWMVVQPWCDGNIGMWGDSYYGYTQWAAVASEHPALKAIVPRVTTADLAGSVGADPVIPLYLGEYLAMYWLDDRIYHWAPDYGHRPLAEVFDDAFEAIGRRAASFDRFVTTSAAGEPLERYPGHHPFDVLRIPVLHTGGWFDNIMPEQMRDYDALIARPDLAHLQYLEMNSTDHENYHLDLVPIRPGDDHDTDDEALARMLPRYLGSALDFFDRFLKGEEVAIPRVRWHHGNDGWREASSWPPPGSHEMRLHLVAARSGRPRAFDGRRPLLVPARGSGRGTCGGSPRRADVHVRRLRSAHRSDRPGVAPHRRRLLGSVDGGLREGRRCRSRRNGADVDSRPGDAARPRSITAGARRPRPPRLSPAGRPPPAGAARLERLPALPAPPGHRRGPLASRRWATE